MHWQPAASASASEADRVQAALLRGRGAQPLRRACAGLWPSPRALLLSPEYLLVEKTIFSVIQRHRMSVRDLVSE